MPHLTPLYDLSELEISVAGGDSVLILAANRRLAAKISQAYQHKASLQRQALVPPQVFAIGDYLQDEYQRAVLNGQLPAAEILPSTLERHLWRTSIKQHLDDDTSLINLSSTVPLAKSAHQMALQYKLESSALKPQVTRWITAFEARCQALGMIPSYVAEVRVIAHLCQKPSAQRVLFVGFEDFTPLYRSFYTSVGGCELSPLSHSHQEQLLWYEDREQELSAAVDAAIEYTREHPSHRFGIVDPSLGQHRGIVNRLVSERLSLSARSVFTDREIVSVNISAGQTANEVPLIQMSLCLLETWRDRLDMASLYALCHTPFIALADTEALPRSTFYQQMLSQGRPDNSQAFLRERASDLVPGMVSMWSAAYDQSRRLSLNNQTFSVAQWCEYLEHLLLVWGWPGQRETDSSEYQQLVLWRDLMADLKRFPDEISLGLSQFQALLNDHVSNSTFQPEVEDSAIQILGSLEAASLRFDRLWIVGMSDNEFPAPASPHPYIDLHVQRQYRMPHCDAARELQYSKALLAAYRASCPSITYSYSRFDSDIENRPSSLIRHLSSCQGAVSISQNTPTEVEWFEDEWAPNVVDPSSIRGGASILADQAACPFKAFAVHRLQLTRLDPVGRSIPPHVMGTAIHLAMERVLPEGLASSELVQVAESSIEQAAAAAVDLLRQKRPDIMHERLQLLEKQRISALLDAWLELEQLRPSFVIAATEKPCETSIAGLPLRLRVDRIDQLQSNRLMIIDYKTGSASTSKWRDDRPDDPQLLLYALLGDNGEIDAIAKASLKFGEMGFSGMSGNDTHIKGIKPIQGADGDDPQQLWTDQKIRWHRRLENLAQEFLSGDAQVLPHSDGSCQYCHLSDVCRIGERR